MKKRILAMLLFGLLGITTALAQEREIMGKVTDSKTGEGIPGVAVLVVETKTGNTTDFDGNYKVKASTGNTLRFTYLGYKTQDIKLDASNLINVTLKEDGQLDEVIVTGYGDQKATSYVGSASTIASKNIEQIPIASFNQILQGQVPGLQGGAGSGQPGSASSILIRGRGSINSGTEPLYILDGVPIAANDFASINGNDFESVTVLKDAASTSKYGSRGANGVIVIKSKAGKAGNTQLNYRFQQGLTTRTTDKFTNMNTAQRLDFERMLAEHDIQNGTNIFGGVRTVPAWRTWILSGRPETGGAYNALQATLEPIRAVNTDWKNEFFRTGTIQSHDLSATGGNEKTSFFVSGQYRREEGIVVNSGLDRYTLRSNFKHNATEKFRIGLNTSIGYSHSRYLPSETGNNVANPILGMYTALPYYTPQSDKSNFILAYNPSIVMDVTQREGHNYKLIAGAYMEYDITKNLMFRTNWGGDLSMTILKFSIRPTNAQNQIALDQRGGAGNMSRIQQLGNSFIGTNSLVYNKTFGNNKKHDVSASANFELLANSGNGFGYTGFNVDPKFIDTPVGIPLPSASTIPVLNPNFTIDNSAATGSGFNTFNRLASVFVDASYTFDGKYSFNAGMRRDGSSRFGENKRYGVFYNVGGAWLIDREPFMESIANIVNAAKFRVTYGEQGNQSIGNFGYLATFGAGTPYTPVSANGLVPGNPANPDIQWEGQRLLNFALDFGLLKNRIRGVIEFYNRNTNNLFLDAQITRTTGFASLNRNVGKMRNRGIEFNISGDVISTKDFKWTLTAVHTLNRNKIVDLGGAPEYPLGTSIVRTGIPYGAHYQVGWAGVNPANGDPLYLDKDGNVTTNYNSQNNITTDGKYQAKSFVAAQFGSFTNSFSYKGLELSVFFVYEMEKYLFNNQTFFNQNLVGIPVAVTNKDTRMLNAWTTPGQLTDIPRLNAARQFSWRDIEDASFLRLRNITLSYMIPSDWLKNAKMRSMRAYISAQNALTFTRFTGFDPEDNNNIQLSQYPVPRVFTFGLDLGF